MWPGEDKKSRPGSREDGWESRVSRTPAQPNLVGSRPRRKAADAPSAPGNSETAAEVCNRLHILGGRPCKNNQAGHGPDEDRLGGSILNKEAQK